MLIQPIVLSGGSVTRLWPLSREKYPKQLLPLIGEDSLLQATVRRVEGIPGVELTPPMVVCNEEYRFVIAEQLRLMGKPGTIVLEPAGRNTAPALTLAALSAIKTEADPVLLVMPADHVIVDTPAFQRIVSQGAALASQGAIVTFGSTAGSMGDIGLFAYSATKAALGSLARTIATTYGKQNIRANCVCPGSVWPEAWQAGMTPEFLARAQNTRLTPRLGVPEDIGAMVAFLLSDKASYVTGQTIMVDGGGTVHQPWVRMD